MYTSACILHHIDITSLQSVSFYLVIITVPFNLFFFSFWNLYTGIISGYFLFLIALNTASRANMSVSSNNKVQYYLTEWLTCDCFDKCLHMAIN